MITIIHFAIGNLGMRNKISRYDIMDLLDKEKIIAYREKYGFVRILTGYNRQTEKFFSYSAPLHYDLGSIWSTIIHLNHLGIREERQKDFDEIEYFSYEIKPLTKLQKLYIKHIIKI